MLNNAILLMTQGEEGGGMSFFIFLGLFFVIIYFFMIRPQSKKAKETRNFLDNIQKGDRVVTIGGIHGKIIEIKDDAFLLEVDSSTKLKIERSVLSPEFTKALQERTGGKPAIAEKKK